MSEAQVFPEEELKYLRLLGEKYPTIQEVCTEIINLQAILNLPKGTEHFMSDLHGEYEAFCHILNNCSGVIREKVDLLFSETLSGAERSDFCTLIYYPEEKLEMLHDAGALTTAWYKTALERLIALCRLVSSKYTRSKVRKALPREYSYIIDELLHAQEDEDNNQLLYHQKIIDTIINIDNADAFIIALSTLVKRLAVDCLHIVGDIYDRGPRADGILDMLMEHHCVDIEWGNHDILWMGAAAGSEPCILSVVRNCLSYGNYTTLESGYGISLRGLLLFAARTYPGMGSDSAAALRASTVLLLKLEGQVIKRHPEYEMDDRLLLHKIDFARGTVLVEGKEYPLRDQLLPTVRPADPYALSEGEQAVLNELREAFQESERLHRHVRFLYEKGRMYLCYNENLLFHGCIPLDSRGKLTSVYLGGRPRSGKAYLDYADRLVRRAYFDGKGQKGHQDCLDFVWYLWCGKNSPLFGRSKMTTFERTFLEDSSTWEEKKNPYYTYCGRQDVCEMLLREFGLTSPFSHIINGHVPVRAVEGESPVKAGGKLIVIDGGFCKAYQPTTGIAGYTLIYNSHGMRILSHQPFENREHALLENKDIRSRSVVVETESDRVMVMDTDNGARIERQIEELHRLVSAYREGILIPKHPNRL